MNRRHSRSFRGLHALIEHPPGRDRTVLQTQLELLGLKVTVHDSAAPSHDSIDILFFDADGEQAFESEEAHRDLGLPAVALIGSETPSRLQAMLARQPSAYLMKPIRSTGIYASLAIATHQYATLQAMRRKLASAEERLRSRRLLLAAMLQIMNQAQVGEAEAFRMLRRAAMSRRQTVEAVSAQILAGDFPVPRLLAG
ncbi:ANTAR domain-containing response regulator [Reyranella soli]|uniref:Transcriptional antiterminator n=1 Tax=Reyranella soli TaxID=1230389 RepID=A0A512NJI0_9HYPH|nr:ANTAR domain-containing protein [Reyranella soli]GEP59075.1 transcriptional antiterminator [Reyranella soli]